jgi:protein ImuB
LYPGQPLAEAKALLPNASFLPVDLEEDRSSLIQIALECHRYSPLVGLEEGDNPESLYFEVTGCTHLWHDEERFLLEVRRYWRSRGYRLQLALASTMGAAWALAHHRKMSLVNDGDEEVALSRLPVAALRLPQASLEPLISLGLYRIGDILDLPGETLASRFGAILPKRLNQALGLIHEIFVCELLKEPLSVSRDWEIPIDDRFALNHLCLLMLRELLSKACRLGMGLHELEAEIRTENGPITIGIALVEPTRDERHVMHLIELELERKAWSGAVFALTLTALRLGYPRKAERSWFDDLAHAKASKAFNNLIDRLNSRLNEGAVLRAEIFADPQPEHAVRLVPWNDPKPPNTDKFTFPLEQSRTRPFRLLSIPHPIDVVSVVPDGPPLRLEWLDQDRRVLRSWGPERIATGWWRAQDIERDYYRAECDDCSHVWIYRDQKNGGWFLHGYFD